MKLAVIFGGQSTEHQVSIVSGTSVLYHLDKNKYKIYPIYISKDGDFYEYTKNIADIKVLKIDDTITELKKIENIGAYLQDMDVVFPVLHGKNGEDGAIQGMLEILNKKYVGCHTLASALCMDKIYTKILLERALIPVAKGMYIQKYADKYRYLDKNFNEYFLDINELYAKVAAYLNFPVFIKPANSGSSVGVHRVLGKEDFTSSLMDASKYDSKILIEEEIKGREVECAVLGNNDLIVSTVGEILEEEDFYTFDSKYHSKKKNTIIPININSQIIEDIKNYAKKAFIACDCEGLARIDFFITFDNKIILNEINTMPGFTEISMYPQLMHYYGFDYTTLLDKLILLAVK